jgi:hypothetical protein
MLSRPPLRFCHRPPPPNNAILVSINMIFGPKFCHSSVTLPNICMCSRSIFCCSPEKNSAQLLSSFSLLLGRSTANNYGTILCSMLWHWRPWYCFVLLTNFLRSSRSKFCHLPLQYSVVLLLNIFTSSCSMLYSFLPSILPVFLPDTLSSSCPLCCWSSVLCF